MSLILGFIHGLITNVFIFIYLFIFTQLVNTVVRIRHHISY